MANITCKLKILSVLLRAVIIRAWTLGNMFLQFDRGRVCSCLLSSHWLIDTNLVYLKEDTSPNVFRAILVETVSNSLNRTDFWLKKIHLTIYEYLWASVSKSDRKYSIFEILFWWANMYKSHPTKSQTSG